MISNEKIDLSVVIPIYNEEDTINDLYEALDVHLKSLAISYEIILVNDGSHDHSLSLIKSICQTDEAIKYVSFTRNFGHQNAILAGMEKSNGSAIVIMDGDLQDPPSVIADLYIEYKKGYHVVSARRSKREKEGVFKKWTAAIFYRLMQVISKNNMPLDVGDFRIISKPVAKHILSMGEKNNFLRGQISWLGYKHSTVDYIREGRKFGETKFTTKKMVKFAWDGITSFSNLPLKIAIYCGLIFSLVSFMIVLYALYSKFILNEVVTGWTSLIISVTFIGGVQLLCLGIMGEYISRISDDVKARPKFIIEESNIKDKV